MFWEIVGALLFVSVGIPLIIYGALLLLGGGVTVLSNKNLRNGCLIIVGLIGVGLYIIYDNNQRASQAYLTQYNQTLTYNQNYLQSLRAANPKSSGYILLHEDKNGRYSTVNNTDGTFTVYQSSSSCYSALNSYTERYLYNSFDYDCKLL